MQAEAAVTAACTLSSKAVMLAARHQIPILFFNRMGEAEARLWSPYFSSLAELRRQQALFVGSVDATAWLVRLFMKKTEGKAALLHWLKNRRPGLADDLALAMGGMHTIAADYGELTGQPPALCSNSLMGIEGSIARCYWQAVAPCLPPGLHAGTRSRRPALDPFNATLNYLYGMLYPVVEGALFAAGLDPYLGVLHASQYDKPTLAFDLIEPFRPWVDRLLIEACLQDEIDPLAFFDNKDGGVFLNKAGKRFIIPLFNDFMETTTQYDGRRLSNKNHIYRYAQQFANELRERPLYS